MLRDGQRISRMSFALQCSRKRTVSPGARGGGRRPAACSGVTFLGEMIPPPPQSAGGAPRASQMASDFKTRLEECLERDEQGWTRLTVTLPNESVLETLTRSLAATLG